MENRYNRNSEDYQAKESQLEEIRLTMQNLKSDMESLQSELSEAKLRYQRVSQVSSIGVVVTTVEGRVLECNASAARIFGYSGIEDALSQTDDDRCFSLYSFQGTLGARLQQEGKLENIEWSSLSRDGRAIRLRENAILLEDSSGVPTRIERVLTDITQVHKLSEEIRRIRKVEATGDLLSAAVKSLKNLCESFTQCGRLLKDSPEDSKTVRQVAETILKDANRGSKHARQLLSVSMKTDRIPAVVNLNEILAENVAVLHSLVGEDIDLQIKCPPGMSLITADRQEIIQLISNFVVSSLKNLPLGGIVAIETENIEIDASISEHPEEIPSGTYVLMTISVDGCEVHPERRMTFNRTIVDRMGGWIETTHDPQSGNIHKVYFSRVEEFAGRIIL
jgi:PAS domain S-box-containing protein